MRESQVGVLSKHALEMNLFTLRKMAAGGMHDHLGGGFHRYSVDAYWHVPHFEKMLYDQAQLAVAYLDAFQITREPLFEEVARDILDYVRRDMTAKERRIFFRGGCRQRCSRDRDSHSTPKARFTSGAKRRSMPRSDLRRRFLISIMASSLTATRPQRAIRMASLTAKIF